MARDRIEALKMGHRDSFSLSACLLSSGLVSFCCQFQAYGVLAFGQDGGGIGDVLTDLIVCHRLRSWVTPCSLYYHGSTDVQGCLSAQRSLLITSRGFTISARFFSENTEYLTCLYWESSMSFFHPGKPIGRYLVLKIRRTGLTRNHPLSSILFPCLVPRARKPHE